MEDLIKEILFYFMSVFLTVWTVFMFIMIQKISKNGGIPTYGTYLRREIWNKEKQIDELQEKYKLRKE